MNNLYYLYQKRNNLKDKTIEIIKNKIKLFGFKIPLFLILLYFSIGNLFIIEIVLFICHKEYYLIEKQIIKKIFSEQFSNSTSLTLISSPIQTYLILILPIINFFLKNTEIFSVFFVILLLIMYRFYCFIQIYMLNNTKDFYVNKVFIEDKNEESNNQEKKKNFETFLNSNILSNKQTKNKNKKNNSIVKLKNPLPKNANTFWKMQSKIEKILFNNNANIINSLKSENESNKITTNQDYNETFNSIDTNKDINKNQEFNSLNNNIELKSFKKNTITSLKNSYTKKYITEKMFFACLIVISLDFIFIIFYALPLSYEISLIKTKIGFELILFILVIFFCWRFGELIMSNEKEIKKENIIFNDYDKTLNPINYKNLISFNISLILSIIISFLFRIYMNKILKKTFFNFKQYLLLIFCLNNGCNLGIYFEFFLRKCGNIEENFFNDEINGLINSIKINSLCYPICYFLLYNCLNKK